MAKNGIVCTRGNQEISHSHRSLGLHGMTLMIQRGSGDQLEAVHHGKIPQHVHKDNLQSRGYGPSNLIAMCSKNDSMNDAKR